MLKSMMSSPDFLAGVRVQRQHLAVGGALAGFLVQVFSGRFRRLRAQRLEANVQQVATVVFGRSIGSAL